MNNKPENRYRVNKLIELNAVTKQEGNFILNIMKTPHKLTTTDLNILKDKFKTYIRLSENNHNKKVLYLGILGVINKIISHREEFKTYIQTQKKEIEETF